MQATEQNEWYLEIYGTYTPSLELRERIDQERMDIWEKQFRKICMKDDIDEEMHLFGKTLSPHRIGIFQIIDNFELDFVYGNMVKHVLLAHKRNGHIEYKLQELHSALWYIQKEIEKCEYSLECISDENKVQHL